jgi:hypothetical protein
MANDIAALITLEFVGYWREPNVGGLRQKAGVYCVYACTFNEDQKPKPTVSISKLVYIGEGNDVRARVSGHELWPTWKKQLSPGEVICVSAAPVSPETTRHRAEAALIFKHKPPVNSEYKHSFPFDTATISASGTTAELTTSFSVKKGATD